MTTRFTATSGEGLPADVYQATFAGIDAFESDNGNDYGPAVKLTFKVTEGDRAGEAGSRICSTKFGPKTNLRRFAEAIKGSKIEAGESFDFAAYFGTTGKILVQETDSGATRVETFIRGK